MLNHREEYVNALLAEESSLKKLAREYAESLGLARISVAPSEAQLIKTLVQMNNCKKFVEIGTLTGLSAQYIFEGLVEGGELWTLEKDPRRGEKAQAVFDQVDQTRKKIHLVLGDAREELEKLNSLGPFDGVFIDGNKAAYGDYLAWAERNLRSGGLVLADNIFLSGSVCGEQTQQKFSDKQIRVMQEFNKKLSDPSKFKSAVIPTFEGLFVALKL